MKNVLLRFFFFEVSNVLYIMSEPKADEIISVLTIIYNIESLSKAI